MFMNYEIRGEGIRYGRLFSLNDAKFVISQISPVTLLSDFKNVFAT